MKNVAPIAVALLHAALGCGPGLAPADGPDLESVTDVHQCKAAADAGRPMLVEWAATEKAALQSAGKRGVVVVRYDGCRLKLLDGCSAGGGYGFTETSRSRDGFLVRDRSELFARLPLGAVELEAELGEEVGLELSYVAVGTRDASVSEVSRTGLTGSCEGATHFVRTMVVGAYELVRSGAAGIGAGAEVGGAGVGAREESSRRIIRGDGDLEACLDVATPADDTRCQAVVQLVLEPLGSAASDAPGQTPDPSGVDEPTGARSPHAFSDVEFYPCQAGRTWTGGGCDGMPVRAVWDEAMTACPEGWASASRADLVDLLERCDHAVYNLGKGDCSPCYESGPCSALFGESSIARGAYWTSNAHEDGKAAYYVSFKDGAVRHTFKNSHFEVLCVRPAR
jgi:hypothetical protein